MKLILGNGADLDLGLKTSFTDFHKSIYWERFINDKVSCESLLTNYLKEHTSDWWCDLEKSLTAYAQQARTWSDMEVDLDTKSFCALRTQLHVFLEEAQKAAIDEKSILLKVLIETINFRRSFDIYTFNYTNFKEIVKQKNVILPHEPIHVHGSLQVDDELVLGVGEEEINSKYFFFHKTAQPNYHSTSIVYDLMHDPIVVFYGHSLNEIDAPYFKDFFETRSRYNANRRSDCITIFTKNEKSKIEIKKSMKSWGLNMMALVSISQLNFVCIDELKQGNPYARKSYDLFKSWLQGKNNRMERF